jgi:penicillin-binding protein 1C
MRVRLTRRRAIAGGLAALGVAACAWVRCGPIAPGLIDGGREPSTVVVDRHGATLYEMPSGAGTRGIAIAADRLPAVLTAATLAAEDRRFFSHPGVDPVAIGRALARDLVAWRVVEGGSTITQQVAKLLEARRRRSERRGLTAKLREAILALRLEHRFAKREILAMYLSLASYGNQVVGAERASQAYFGCAASMLTPAQAAFIAALPQQPSRFNPYRDPQAARARQRAVIAGMRAAGSISAAQAREALAERLALARPSAPFIAPHFVEMVLADAGAPRPARLETTIDAGLQAQVEGILASHRRMLDAHGAANVAIVVLDNATGGWLAWEGSGDYFDATHGGAINGPLAPRQPGSALKPLTYALAFEQGETPATVLPDIPTHFPTAEPGVLFSPRNYDGRYRGPLLARRALAGSENVPAVALASEVGVPALLRFFGRAGLTTFDRTASYYGLGITLGNAEVRLAELVAAYAAFARGGVWLAPTWDLRATLRERTRVPLVSRQSAFWITDILSDPEAREFIFGRGGSLEFPFPVAAKTGTSQAYHDNWTIGYTRAVTVGVWVGNFDRKPLRNSTGVTGAAPIFHAVLLAAERAVAGPGSVLADAPVAAVPEGLERVEICGLSGMRANRSCPSRVREWLPPGGDAPLCSWHHATDEGLLVVWPPEYREWALERGLLQDLRGRVVAARRDDGVAALVGDAARPARRLEIVSPPAGALYSIDPTLRREFQAVALRAVADVPGGIEWRVDGERVGRASTDEPLLWPLTPGSHEITARDNRGRTARTVISVR